MFEGYQGFCKRVFRRFHVVGESSQHVKGCKDLGLGLDLG